jgi:dTMP kinase
MAKGKFIVIEGSDGSGKKTQTDILIKKLKEKGIKTSYFDFPQYESTFFGKMVARYLNGEFGEADEVSPYFASLLYAGDRFETKDKIKKDLADGKIVISNRYTESNLGFQTAKIRDQSKKQNFIKWTRELENKVLKIPEADLVIYLYLPFLLAQTLVDKKEKRGYTELKRDIHEKNNDFLLRVENQYLNLAKNPKWRLIDCQESGEILSIKEIAKKVEAVIKKEKII